MKISSTTLIAFGVAAAGTLSAKVQASCTPADQGGANDGSDDVENRNPSCKEYSGSCSLAVEKYQTGGNTEDVQKVFSYGNYCGVRRQCQSQSNKDPPTPCNAIDAACQAHDECTVTVDGVYADCNCEITFLATLAEAFSSMPFGGTSGLVLCDEPYYEIFGFPEALLIAAPYCAKAAVDCVIPAGLQQFCNSAA